MNILVACEESQEVTKAFRAKGHNAFSCDVMPCSGGRPEWHIQADVMGVLSIPPLCTLLCATQDGGTLGITKKSGWDMVIAHPPCTYLCNSGVRWLAGNPKRVSEMKKASSFFKQFIKAQKKDGFKLCIENPIPHRHGKLPPYSQIIHPWQFGHGETKATCLWLYGLPELRPTDIVSGRKPRIHHLPPSADRARLRSKTYTGIALAMAEQWG